MGVYPVCLLASRAAWWVRCWLGCGVGAYLIASAALAATPVTLVTYRAAESALDRRNDYTIAVLKLALDKTRDEYGDYLLQPSLPMNTARARQALLTNSYENFIVKFSYDPELERAGLKRGGFEPDLDITSYRICFTRRTLLPELSQIGSLQALRPFSHGQGSGWQDVTILRHNGFAVQEVGQYESLFKMVASGRFDLFCRGINEAMPELQSHQSLPQLALDSHLLLYYPLPRFFYTNARHSALLQRVDRGLEQAFVDGDLQKLWLSFYADGIRAAQLDKRQLLVLQNPGLEALADSRRISYDPFSQQFRWRLFATPRKPTVTSAPEE